MKKTVFTTFEAAKYCNTSHMSINNWTKSGKIKAYKTPGGHRRILVEDLHDFMRQNNIPIPTSHELVKTKVLIVDDDENIRDTIVNFLSPPELNFEVEIARDGYEAGMKVLQFLPDIVILDLMMPVVDGFKVCKSIKDNPATKNVKLIVLTGYYNKENIERAYEAGADRVVSKLMKSETMLKELESLRRRIT